MSSDDIITTGVAIDTTGINKGIERLDALAATGPKVDKALQSVEQSAAKTGKSLATLGQGSGAGLQDAAQKVDQSSKSIAQSIQRTADAAVASDKAHKEAAKSIDGIGVSAAQTAAAMRQLPAQFSDIVSSIQGGQKPLSVFLQQGSQIKDSFGGAGAAAKAMSGYIAGLVSPFSIAAAAAAGLTLAAYKGSQEAQEFRKNLILTGNAAGVTAGQLISMSEAVKSMGGGTQGRAAEILNQLASSGLIGANSLAKFADAALRMQKVGGPAAEETAAAFEALGRSPAAAAAKLNESTNFLTASLYQQIKALEDQGRTVDAARLAQEAYADTLNQRSPQLLQNLGYIERAWLAVKDATKGAADSLLSIGRELGDTDKIKALQNKISATQAGNFDKSTLPALQAQLKALQDQAKAAEQAAVAEGKKNEQVKAGIKWRDEANQYLTDAQRMQQELNRLTIEGVAAGQDVLEITKRIAFVRQQYDTGAGLEAIRRAETEREEQIKRGLDAINTLRNTGYINERTQIEEVTRLDLAAIDAKRAGLVAELDYQSKRINSEKEVEALKTQIAAVDEQRTTRQAQGVNQITEALHRQKLAIDAVNDAQREENDADWNRALVEQSKAREAIQIRLYEYSKGLKDEAEQMQLEVELMSQSNVVRNARLAQFKIELELRKQLEAINNTHYEGGDPERELARQQARVNAAKASAQAETRAYLDEWQKTADKISDGLTDALLRGFESGKGFAENLRDTVVNMFKTMVLRPVVQAIVQPVAGTIAGALGGAGGLGGLGALLTGGNAFGGAPLGGYGGVGIVGGIGGGVGGLLQSAGDWLSGGLGSLGTGPFSGLGGWLSSQGQALSSFSSGSSLLGSLGNGLGYLNALSSLSQGKLGAAAGAGLGTLFGGPIGSALGGFLGGAVDKLFGGDGKDYFGADYMRSSSAATGYRPAERAVGDRQYGFSINGARSTQVEDSLKSITDAAIGSISTLQAAFGKTGEFQLGTYFSANGDKSQGNIKLIKDGQTLAATSSGNYGSDATAAFKAYASEVAGTVRTALDGIGLPTWATHMLDGLGQAPTIEQLAGTVQQITATQAALKNLGDVMPKLSGLTDSAIESLLKSMGGIEGLTQAAQSYYQNFYSDAERSAAVTKQLSTAFEQLGLQLPTTREGFRQLVEAQDLNTEAGRNTYAALLKLNPAFASVVAATESLGTAADQSAASVAKAAQAMADAGKKVMADLADQQGDLQIDLLRAKGDTAGADSLQRQRDLAKLTAGLSAGDAIAVTAMYAYNEALKAQIKAENDATAATAAAAEKAKAIASEKSSLENQLLQLQGNTTEIRKRELEQLDLSNRTLLERIYALQDEQTAQQKTAQAAAEAEQQKLAVASQRLGLEGQLLQLQGNTAELRARELAALDPSNRALQEQINALQDQQAAAQKAAEAMQHVADVMAGLGNTRFDLENQLLSLQGNTAEVLKRTRERDLAALTKGLSAEDAAKAVAAYDYNESLKRQIEVFQDAQKAAEESARQAEQAAQAAQQLKQAWQSVTDSIFGEVQRIRELIGGTSAQSFAEAQARFTITSAQARAGDQEAAKLLPGLAQTMLTLAESQATSLFELQRIRAQAAGSLEGTGNILASRYGLSLPKFATGTNYVPQDMVAVIHEGEAIVPKAFNPAAGGSSNAEILEELRALRQEARENARSIANLQLREVQVLEQWDGEGMPAVRT